MGFVWLTRPLLDLIHEDQRQQHGGNVGVLNDNGIESALARAQYKLEDAAATVFECAAAYAFSLARNHGYHDANKRTAFMAALTFLRLNGWRIAAAPEDVLTLMVGVAVGSIEESEIAVWFEARASQLGGS